MFHMAITKPKNEDLEAHIHLALSSSEKNSMFSAHKPKLL